MKIFGVLLVAVAMAAPAGAATRAEIVRVLASLDAAVAAEDRAAIHACYDLSDSTFREETEARLGEAASADSLRVTHRLTRLEESRGIVVACVFRDATYRESGRVQADAAWFTMKFRRAGGSWKIFGEDQRDYARALSSDLRVDLFPDEGRMHGEQGLRIRFTSAGEDNVALDLNRGLDVASITDGAGRRMAFSRTGTVLVVSLGRQAAANDSLSLEIRFDGTLFNETRELGYSQVGITPGGSFASWVTHWYPRLRGVGSKSTGRILFTTPKAITVACSGRPVERVVDGGRERHVFVVSSPLDFSFAAAPYFHSERLVEGITVGAYLLKGGDAKAELYLSSCARILHLLRGVYGFYPFDSYSVVEVPSEAVGTLGGSSEQGMNLFPVGQLPDGWFPLPLVAHEIGHSWWGNLVAGKVTVIDEGLAQMTAVLCVEEIDGEDAMRRFLKYGYPQYDQSAMMYYRRFAGTDRDLPLGTRASTASRRAALHDLADTKGHFVYQMLRETIGSEAFVLGLRAALGDFARREIDLDDLRKAWEKASGRDLATFFRQWFDRTGAPEFAMRDAIDIDAGGAYLRGVVSQSGEPYDADVEIAIEAEGKRRVERLHVSGPETPFEFHVGSRPDTVLFDPQYKVFRWTPEFGNFDLLDEAIALRTARRFDEAIAALHEYLAKAPGEPAALYQVGLCHAEEGRRELAEHVFRSLLDRRRALAIDHPVLPLAALRVGEICDMSNRRDEAVAWYKQVLSMPDEHGCHRDAEAALASPFSPRAPGKKPSLETLERFAGEYALMGMKITFSATPDTILLGRRDGEPDLRLEWIEGSRFGVAGAGDITVEFAGGESGPVETVKITSGERVYDLMRSTAP